MTDPFVQENNAWFFGPRAENQEFVRKFYRDEKITLIRTRNSSPERWRSRQSSIELWRLNSNLASIDQEKQTVDNDNLPKIRSWGHVTCDGSLVSPLNSPNAWKTTVRKISYLRITPHGNCSISGQPLNIPERLYQKHGIKSQFLQTVFNDYSIQTLGKDYLEQKFGITKPSLYLISTTKHYSWPKGCANLKKISVDDATRMDINKLAKILMKYVKNKQAVYAVVAIIGSTEQGACDPLANIVALRDRYQCKYGLSFIHGDAACGGYFRSMLVKPHMNTKSDGRLEVHEEEPHEITWSSAYILRPEEESIGVYDVEGSKPGAVPVAVWLSHDIIGLHQNGYGDY
ncbi:11682_t:CDS:2 [Ambispora leptoticha]|uniref:11682_t:CDS:1 n=1 Tax=Ambispora leptoticha TaxID=144679 RepID=A0A9N9GQE2_9GLOM|nr:11682_t:CDS:2 [Ambispora leptoticha]